MSRARDLGKFAEAVDPTGNVSFADATGILDDSGNEQMIFQKTASAATYVEVTNNTTGNAPSIAAAGTGSGSPETIDLNLLAKGEGEVQVNGDRITVECSATEAFANVGDEGNFVVLTDVTETVDQAVEDVPELTWTNLPVGVYEMKWYIMTSETSAASGANATGYIQRTNVTLFNQSHTDRTNPWNMTNNQDDYQLIEVTNASNSLKVQLFYDHGFGAGGTATLWHDSWVKLKRIK